MVKNTVTGTSSDWQDVAVRGSHTGRRPLPAVNRVAALTADPRQGLEAVSGFESFPLGYTPGRHEGARRKARVELMQEPADRTVLLLQRVSELLLESRVIVKELEVVPDGESLADSADRIAYGILVAGLEEGLVNTIRHALDVLKRFSASAGALGEKWLIEQGSKLRPERADSTDL